MTKLRLLLIFLLCFPMSSIADPSSPSAPIHQPNTTVVKHAASKHKHQRHHHKTVSHANKKHHLSHKKIAHHNKPTHSKVVTSHVKHSSQLVAGHSKSISSPQLLAVNSLENSVHQPAKASPTLTSASPTPATPSTAATSNVKKSTQAVASTVTSKDKDDNLTLRPGDQLHIAFPGEASFNKDFTIDYRGYIMLPEIGNIPIGGLTLGQAKKAISHALSLSYQHTDFVKINLQSRMLVIHVLGHVGNPGRVILPEDANIQMALNAAGGIRDNAETSRIQLRRGDHSSTFDYRKYLDTGELTLLPELKTMDTIFVPSSTVSTAKADEKILLTPESSLKVIGAVSRAGGYKWEKERSLLDYIVEAGGLNNNADTANIKILRQDQQPLYYDLEQFLKQGGNIDNMPTMKPGDIIQVPDLSRGTGGIQATWHQLPADESIYLFGAVGNPGRYRFKPGFDLIDLLAASGGASAGADIRDIRIIDHNSYRPNIQVANLAFYFNTGDRSLLPALKAGDIVFIPSNVRGGYWLDYSPESTVRVLGSVGRPGHYHFVQDMTVLDLLTEAGGPSGTAYLSRIVIIHMSRYQSRATSFNLLRFMKTGDIRLLPVIRPGDTIYVPDESRTLWNRVSTGLRDVASFALITTPFNRSN